MAPRISRLLVNRNRIMALRVDAFKAQELEQRIPLFRPLGLDDVEVVDVTVPWPFVGQRDVPRAGQSRTVTRRPLPAQVIPFVDVLQFRAEHASVQIVEPAVVSRAVARALGRTVIAQAADDGVDLRAIGHHCAAVAKGSKVLLNDEADGGGVAQLSDPEAVAACADGLRIVLNHQQVVPVGNLADGFHIRALAIQMDRHQGLGAGRDRRLDFVGVDTVRLRIAVNKDDRCPCDPDRFRGCEERVAGGDALVATTDAERLESEPQCVRPVAHADGIFRSVIICQLLLEPLQHRAHHVLAAFQHCLNVLINFRLNIMVLPDVTVEFNFHGAGS